MPARQTKFYKDKRHGKIMGVCAGVADFTGIDVTLIRIGFVLGTFVGSGFPLLAYIVIGMIADDRPSELDYADRETARFWQGVRAKPANSIRDVRSRFREIDRRLADIELHYTSQNTALAAEIDSLR
ncbi:envelope stress response membrane protein PspC [Sphingomonas quercus]|uniref:Envelope stress response membrane protein PspC n=1 Tax=Sphingomonas quercus TaxID=2842451 RepID=A0ABS6BLV9_9SPHN|nr:envelope stress response membrane protein PspC [Sphingomonas quercus]MBU3078381.1 envelope stress response membrane protein PspC [Sphingomonas quercus]